MSSDSLQLTSRQPADRCPGFLTALVLRCAAGDEAALGLLFDHLYPLVVLVVRGQRPSGSVDALVRAAFGRLWEQAPAYDPKLREPVEWVVAQTRAVCAELLVDTVPRARGQRAARRRSGPGLQPISC